MRFAIGWVVVGLVLGCSGSSDAPDSGARDGGPDRDAGFRDGGVVEHDGGFADAGFPDSGVRDGGLYDWRPGARDLLRPFVEDDWAFGFSVVVWRDGLTEYMGVGRVGPTDTSTPAPDTIYEIASLTKPFTTTLLALAVEDGDLSLDTQLADLVPPDVNVPVRGVEPIRLRHLATHTSGLPVWPRSSIVPPAAGAPPNQAIDRATFYQDLSSTFLEAAPGVRAIYSSFGVGWLGVELMRAQGVDDLDALMAPRLVGPLGLVDTKVALNGSQAARLAPPHVAPDEPALPTDLDALNGAIGLHSTAVDLGRWIEAQVDPPATPLGDAIRATHEKLFEVDGDGLGLGWTMLAWRGNECLTHSGTAFGGQSMIMIWPEERVGVALLTNTRMDAVIVPLGFALADEARGLPWPEAGFVWPTPRPTITPSLATLEELAATYRRDTTVMHLVVHEERLYFYFDGNQRYYRLFATAPDEFHARAFDVRVLVVRDPVTNAVTGIRWLQTADNLYTRDP